jgi:hypothetical protein
MIKSKITTIFIFILFACGEKDRISYLEARLDSSLNMSNFEIDAKINKIRIPSSCLSDYQYFKLLADSLLLCKDGFKVSNKIDIFNIKTNKYLESVSWDKAILPDAGSFAFFRQDSSIYLNAVGSIKYFKLSFDGIIQKSWAMSDIMIDDNNNINAIYPSLFSYSEPIVLDNDRLLVSFTMPEAFFFKDTLIDVAMISLSQNKILTKYRRQPNLIYAQMKNSAYPQDLSFAYKMLKGDTLILSYPMDHFIYAYDLYTGKFLFKKPIILNKSKISLPHPLSKYAYGDRQDQWNFRITTPFYEPLNFHKNLNLYSRILHHPISKDQANNKKGPLNRSLSLILLDKNLDVVGEEILNHEHIGIYRTIATPDGLISIPNNNSDVISDDFLTLSHIQIKRK